LSRPIFPERERGAALLAVLILVAITGAIAASALERLRLSRLLSTNSSPSIQARHFAAGAEAARHLDASPISCTGPQQTTLAAAGTARTRTIRCRAAAWSRRG
jgi:general secretion pathway protein K